LCLSKVTLHPASVNTRIPNSVAIDKSGIMCPVRTKRRPLMCMSHMCVDMTCHPFTLSGRVVRRLLITLAPSMTKIWLAPESAMAAAMLSQNIAPANSLFCRRADKARALYEPAV
jgi:hypothetical protein